MNNLFHNIRDEKQPLAYRMRPKNISEYVGQKKIIGKETILYKMIKQKKIMNSIFFGPPGTGKTSLAKVIAKELNEGFESLNASTASVKDIKLIVEKAEIDLRNKGEKTILFLDEIHRFNKLQQDSLLPATEKGIIVLIGATTENPYYSLNNSLLSRVMVFEFEKLKDDDIKILLRNAIKLDKIKIKKEIENYIVEMSFGDARRALNYLEVITESEIEQELEMIKKIFGKKSFFYDRKEDKSNIVSALIKSIRGTAPDAAIYWLAKLLEGGEDPKYIARRLVILAAEDIGLANPEALIMANSALNASKEIGMPEIRIILAEVVLYLAISSKSNSSYLAINSAIEEIKEGINYKVPNHIKKNNNNAYLYPHNYKENYVKQDYLGENKKYYKPGKNKRENLIQVKLDKLRR
ncbi:MAG: recombinase RarA [Fusobacteriia bacterium 4572_132]|nr:MAG: recombinase RarA [Fusobacteriia bacterium 4572_132]